MTNELIDAIHNGSYWVERFSRTEYAKAFTDYRGHYEQAYKTAALTNDAETLAESVITSLMAALRKERFWNRAGAKADAKTVMIAYLFPMLLELGEEELCAALCRSWNEKNPGDTVKYASYEKLQKGFGNKIFGFSVGTKREEE